MGDAVFDFGTAISAPTESPTSKNLHKATVSCVSAPAQAQRLGDDFLLTPENGPLPPV